MKAFFHQVGKIGTNAFFMGCYLSTHFFLLKAFFQQIKKYKERKLFSSKNFHSCAWHIPVIGTCPVSKITLVLGKNDLRQADNSGFPGVNHPCEKGNLCKAILSLNIVWHFTLAWVKAQLRKSWAEPSVRTWFSSDCQCRYGMWLSLGSVWNPSPALSWASVEYPNS